jgi:hypothetical protein
MSLQRSRISQQIEFTEDRTRHPRAEKWKLPIDLIQRLQA